MAGCFCSWAGWRRVGTDRESAPAKRRPPGSASTDRPSLDLAKQDLCRGFGRCAQLGQASSGCVGAPRLAPGRSWLRKAAAIARRWARSE